MMQSDQPADRVQWDPAVRAQKTVVPRFLETGWQDMPEKSLNQK
jgi:hypothetical protein